MTMRDLWMRLRALLRRSEVEREMEEELRFHFEAQVEKLVGEGVGMAEALRRARLAIGGTEQIKEECRDARGVRLVETVWQGRTVWVADAAEIAGIYGGGDPYVDAGNRGEHGAVYDRAWRVVEPAAVSAAGAAGEFVGAERTR
ncbi:MAG: permease prefix domain 1-containing protein [Candidatus Acidiferrum sp.]